MKAASTTQADALAAKLQQKNSPKYACRTAALSQKPITHELSEIPTHHAMPAGLSTATDFRLVARSLATIP
jgi:hypothetical protein